MFDLGYLGVEKTIPDQKVILTKQKEEATKTCLKKKKSITGFHSRKRIVMEHTICRIKKYRTVCDVFRNSFKKFDKVSDMLAGMAN